ncbi:Metallo-dependent phosphatase-like protein [Russula brevipes]|nr:Metallo-dependent phosphatase-like protein [Russula brevipes]
MSKSNQPALTFTRHSYDEDEDKDEITSKPRNIFRYLTSIFGSSDTALTNRRPRPRIHILCISDTHGMHRRLTTKAITGMERLPDADILIHAGDFTNYGAVEEARDFDAWLGEQTHIQHRIVVQGNHEYNTKWMREINTRRQAPISATENAPGGSRSQEPTIISNAVLLLDESIEVMGLKIHGTCFYWNVRDGNPGYSLIPADTDIVIAHNPPRGYGDKDSIKGCASLLASVSRLPNVKLVISGHHHAAHGVRRGKSRALARTVFVNAASCHEGSRTELQHGGILMEIDRPGGTRTQ